MPLTKVNGEYFTPGGCSAWNGRCFDGAKYDFKCAVAYILFKGYGWYRAENIPWNVMDDWFTHNEDPGCWWNSKERTEFRFLWERVNDGIVFLATSDLEWDAATLEWNRTFARNERDWFTPCPVLKRDDTFDK